MGVGGSLGNIEPQISVEALNPSASLCGCPLFDYACLATGCPDFLPISVLSDPVAFGIDPCTIGANYSVEYAIDHLLPKVVCAPQEEKGMSLLDDLIGAARTTASAGKDLLPVLKTLANAGVIRGTAGAVLTANNMSVNTPSMPPSPMPAAGMGMSPMDASVMLASDVQATPAGFLEDLKDLASELGTDAFNALFGDDENGMGGGVRGGCCGSCSSRPGPGIVSPGSGSSLWKTDCNGKKRVAKRTIAVDDCGRQRVLVDAGPVVGKYEKRKVSRPRRRSGGR